MNPWTIESIITHAKTMAERNGFALLPGEYNIIKILATKPPYGRNVTIARLNDWAAVELYFTGYEQAKMELGIVDALAKGKGQEGQAMTKPYAWVDGNSRLQRYQIDPLVDIPLYTKQEWKGLTDKELMEILGYVTNGYIPDYTRIFVDAIEAKLKEKNGG